MLSCTVDGRKPQLKQIGCNGLLEFQETMEYACNSTLLVLAASEDKSIDLTVLLEKPGENTTYIIDIYIYMCVYYNYNPYKA